jgi:prepilin-type N-terminal cleavage/methylation domain-containing protein
MELPNQHSRRLASSGFTLVEIMVVIVIILLMLGLAVPVLHVITGSQSEAGATNMIAAMLGRARTDAIGLQKPIGVAFIYNPSTNVQTMAEVEFPTCEQFTTATPVTGGTCVYTLSGSRQNYFMYPPNVTGLVTVPRSPGTAQTSNPPNATSWLSVGGPPLELKKDTDLQQLPAGIAVQTVSNCTLNNSGQRNSDGYLSIGVILFDGQGRLTSLPYGICAQSLLGTAAGLTLDYPTLGQNIYIPNSTTQYGVMSQYGLVVFQRNAFVSQGFPAGQDAAYAVSAGGQSSYYTSPQNGFTQSQQQEEDWIDQNSTPLLINRFTGTLIRGE